MDLDEVRNTLKDPGLLNFACAWGTLLLTYDLLNSGNDAWGHYLVALVYGAGFIFDLWSRRNAQVSATQMKTDSIAEKAIVWSHTIPSQRLRTASYASAGFATILLAVFVTIDVITIPAKNC